MKVEIVQATKDPIDIISQAAGTSYGKRDSSLKRLKHCLNNGHLSVFEHASATFYISGMSRACSHQLVRHRVASFVQKSQRYTKVEGDDWYIIPDSIRNIPYFKAYQNLMDHARTLYFELIDYGIKPEDARYLLPEATKTDITMTMNCRELFHFWDLRDDSAAQWEIRGLARDTQRELLKLDGWYEIIDMYLLKRFRRP